MDPAIISVIGVLSKAVVDAWVVPKLKELFDRNEVDKNFYDLVSDKFADYLRDSYKNQLIMNTIVFKNQQKTIDELYIPLYLNKISNDFNDKQCIKIDTYSDEFIPQYKKIIITDTAGMGKSTIMKWLFINVIRLNKGIPIFIELRKLSENNSVIDEIFKNINPIDKKFNVEYVLNLLRRGDFIFFFDGYDEIAAKDKVKVTEDIQWFISKSSENLFVMSSRDESALVSFGDFQRFSIKPLEKEEAFELIKKYDTYGELSKELISKIEDDENLSLLTEFLINPLMTSLLYKAYEYKKVIPYKKSLFYRQVYDALFEVHDFSKGGVYVHDKKSKLDMDDFEEILKSISYKSFIKNKVSYSREEIIDLIKEAKEKNSKMLFKESEFLEDLVKNVPLFIRDGLEFKWTHKSFQEYFTAKYICHNLKHKQKDVLLNMAKSSRNYRYFNVLDFCYDIDYCTFKKSIILDLISSYIEHYNNRQLFNNIEINDEAISERKILTFSNKYFFYLDEDNRKSVNRNIPIKIRSCIQKKLGGFNTILQTNDYNMGNKELPNNKIIKLLRNKKEDFITLYNIKYKKNIIYNLKDLPRNELLILDESNVNILNRSDNFININKLISDFWSGNDMELFKLDIEKCVKLKKEIEEEIELEMKEEDIF